MRNFKECTGKKFFHFTLAYFTLYQTLKDTIQTQKFRDSHRCPTWTRRYTGGCYFLNLTLLPSILKYLYSVQPIRMHFPMYKWHCVQYFKQHCTQYHLFRGKMHSDWFNGIELLQGRWQHGEKAGYCYLSGLEKTLCKWGNICPAGHERVKPFTQFISSSR
jgi:hypothetical protein